MDMLLSNFVLPNLLCLNHIVSVSYYCFLSNPIGHNYYKIHLAIASKAKGKSGGARVITHLVFKDSTVYLLTIYDISEIENLTDKEILELIKLIP